MYGDDYEAPNWTYKDEMKKMRQVAGMAKLGADFDPSQVKIPEDINAEFFPDMETGNVIEDINEARQLIAQLTDMPSLTPPALAPSAHKVGLMYS